jgi:hypothetical protein
MFLNSLNDVTSFGVMIHVCYNHFNPIIMSPFQGSVSYFFMLVTIISTLRVCLTKLYQRTCQKVIKAIKSDELKAISKG